MTVELAQAGRALGKAAGEEAVATWLKLWHRTPVGRCAKLPHLRLDQSVGTTNGRLWSARWSSIAIPGLKKPVY